MKKKFLTFGIMLSVSAMLVACGETTKKAETADALFEEKADDTENASQSQDAASEETDNAAENDLQAEDATTVEATDDVLSGIWQTASIGYEDGDNMQPSYYVQFTDSEIQYGHMADGEFVLEYADKICSKQATDINGYRVQAESSNGVQYTYQTSEQETGVLDYFETWNEDEFSEKYSGGASLSKNN